MADRVSYGENVIKMWLPPRRYGTMEDFRRCCLCSHLRVQPTPPSPPSLFAAALLPNDAFAVLIIFQHSRCNRKRLWHCGIAAFSQSSLIAIGGERKRRGVEEEILCPAPSQPHHTLLHCVLPKAVQPSSSSVLLSPTYSIKLCITIPQNSVSSALGPL